jgi:two-component system, NtrC family, C4-dicarboxylate transport response regulator DctD
MLPQAPPIPLRQWRGLLLDDDGDSLDSLSEFLREFFPELRVDGFTDPEAGLRALAERPYDLVMTDYKMPKHTGIDILRIAKESQPLALRILMTAYATLPGAAAMPADVAAHLILLKPLHTRPFIDLLQTLLLDATRNAPGKPPGTSKL